MCAKFLRSLCIVSLVVTLSSSQLHARPPKLPTATEIGKAIREMMGKGDLAAYAVLLVPPAFLTLVLGAEGFVLGSFMGCIGFLTVKGACVIIDREFQRNTPDKTEATNNLYVTVETTDSTAITRGDEFVNEAIAKSYVGEMVHYTENVSDASDRPIMSDHVDRVIRTVHDEEAEILVLRDGHEVSIGQVAGVGSGIDFFGDMHYFAKVFFSTTAAQPLNELANRLVSEGMGVVEGRVEYYFNNGKILVEVKKHGFTDVRTSEKAQFLIARDELLLPEE